MVYLSKYLDQRNERLASAHKAKTPRILKGEKRKHVVHQVMDLLKDWRFSKFENEGPARAGLRSAFCLNGYGWGMSDHEAEALISESLRTIGAKRPTWEEGQWHYTLSPDQCVWCMGEIEDADRARGFRFCSAMCASSANEYRNYRHKRSFDAVAKNAWLVIKTDEAPEKRCQHCQAPFKRFGAQYEGNIALGRFKFCSVACADASKRVYADRDCAICTKTFAPKRERQFCCSPECGHQYRIKPMNRECLCCGVAFRSYRLTSKPSVNVFCSKECSNKFGRRAQIERECRWCGKTYLAKSSKSRCCSKSCTQLIVNFNSGKWKPKVISPNLVDYLFRNAGLSVTRKAA